MDLIVFSGKVKGMIKDLGPEDPAFAEMAVGPTVAT